ncbi:MAG TPA: ABC transporter substrate-binding protein [Chloroflexota bacterium]|jgi:ABC-type nitrate/sulfonate/bicarbonate transport system substrate-binding protein
MSTPRRAALLLGLTAVLLAAACARSPSGAAPAPQSPAPAAAAAPAPPGASASAPAPTAPSGPKEEITFAIPDLSINYIVPLTAVAKGFFDEAGLSVQIQPMPSNLTVAALQRGDLQLTGSGGSAIRAAVQGAPFKLVSFMTERPTYFLMTVPDLRSPAQLAGARVGVNGIGGTLQFFAEMYARQQGIDPAQIVFVGLGPNPVQQLAAMQAGAIDAAVFDPGSAAVAENQGFVLMKALGEVASDPQQGVVTSDDYIQKSPGSIQAFLKGLVRALVYVKQNQEDAVAIAQQQLGHDMDAATARRAIQLYADAISAEAPGYADAKELEAFYEYDVRIPLELPADQPIPPEHDFRYLLAAYDELGIPRPR